MTEETGRYRTPGELIRAARNQAQLGLTDLSSRTRIPEHVLVSLEIDDYETLSGPLYVRSFLKAIASELDLDADQLVERYDAMVAADDPDQETGEPTWETETRVERVAGLPWPRIALGAAVVVVVVLVVWGGLSLLGGEDDPGDVVAEQAPATGGEILDEGVARESEAHPDSMAASRDEAVADSLTVAASATVPVSARPGSTAPTTIPVGSERMVFAGGVRFPLVLRLVCSSQVGAAVAVDADAALHGVDWRSALTGVPEDGIEPGRPYRVGGRLVAYWGAQDHFVIRLEESEGVELTLNGVVKPVRERNLGREWVLDATRLGN